jgi:hypothetical protein
MRLSGRNVFAVVGFIADATSRPVRTNIGGITYRMELDEAIDLANDLAEAVADIRNNRRRSEP